MSSAPRRCAMAETTDFFKLSDDVVLNIFSKLEDDPRNWARLSCVCTKFSSLVHASCYKHKCSENIPAVCSDLIGGSSAPPGGWASLHKIAVCCPGLLQAGVLLENSDFGLERELGPDERYQRCSDSAAPKQPCPTAAPDVNFSESAVPGSDSSSWSLFDDLYLDTVYNPSDSPIRVSDDVAEKATVQVGADFSISKRRKLKI